MAMARRVLWLLNHTTLREFEVPIIRELGFEVYLPKVFPYNEGNLSASVAWEYDKHLTIPPDELRILNEFDFYDQEFTEAIERIINEYFDIAIFGFFPAQMKELVNKFRGTMVMRPFGLDNGATYTKVTAEVLGTQFLQKIHRIRNRFWFGQAYEHLADVETGIYKQRAITLPLGLRGAHVQDTWTGGDKRLLFVCPRINSSPYFKRIYQNFKSDFSDIPYIIGGAQPIRVADKHVTGYLERSQFDSLLDGLGVMFYHSQEKRHLHYHPIEAIKHGMPLVFMANGMLDELGGRNLPGRSKTLVRAKRKIKLILKGDQKLIAEIRESQAVLLEKMTYEYCLGIWRHNFAIIEDNMVKETLDVPKRRVAVILPAPYRGGTLDTVKLLAKMIKKGAAEDHCQVDVVLAYPESPLYKDSDFKDLQFMGISSRPFTWAKLPQRDVSNIGLFSGYESKLTDDEYLVPNDGINNLLDCDFWFIVSDRMERPLAPLRPYSVLVTDYIQRYVPELFKRHYEHGFIQSVRNASLVLANTPPTAEDCVQYAGVSRRKIKLVPLVSDFSDQLILANQWLDKAKGNYFIWTTNTSIHKNHLRTLEALKKYYEHGGLLGCKVTGVNTGMFDVTKRLNKKEQSNHYVQSIRGYIEHNPILRKNITFMGELERSEYLQVLSEAKFLLHTVLNDNGTFCAIEAVSVGVPTLSSDYPSMRYLSGRYSLNCQFFDPYDVDDMSEKIKLMQDNVGALTRQLPSIEVLDEFSWEKQSSKLWDSIKYYIK